MNNVLKKKESVLFKEAIKLRDVGNYAETIKTLKELLSQNPNSAAYNGTIAGIFFEEGKYQLALRYFKKTVILSPRSELGSLGYFHSLLNLNYFEACLKEIERFLKQKDCDDYIEIIKELNTKINSKKYIKYKYLIEHLVKTYLNHKLNK